MIISIIINFIGYLYTYSIPSTILLCACCSGAVGPQKVSAFSPLRASFLCACLFGGGVYVVDGCVGVGWVN